MGGDLIQTPQTLWQRGLYQSVNRGTIIVLIAHLAGTALNARFTTCRQIRTTAGYIVPTGKILYITDILVRTDITSLSWWLEDTTNDVGWNSDVAGTARVRIDDPFSQNTNALFPGAVNTTKQFSYYAAIPAGRYITAAISATGNALNLMLFAHEENA